MAQRSILFVLVSLLLAACATTAPKPVALNADDSAVVYQQGVTTRYSVSMDELSSASSLTRQRRLPNAVVAGDQCLTVAASLFRRGDVFTLDLIVQNHSDHRFEIERSSMDLFDNRGLHLFAMYDWPDGESYGLRSIREFRRDYAHMGRDFEETNAGRDRDPDLARQERTTKHVPGNSQQSRVNTGTLESASSQVNSDYSWINDLNFEDQTLILPAVCELYPGKNRAYWAYWQVPRTATNTPSKIEFPLTATVVMDGKRMLFRFEEPGTTRVAR
jgi:hypothetical protein